MLLCIRKGDKEQNDLKACAATGERRFFDIQGSTEVSWNRCRRLGIGRRYKPCGIGAADNVDSSHACRTVHQYVSLSTNRAHEIVQLVDEGRVGRRTTANV